MVERGLIFQVLFHLMTQPNPIIWLDSCMVIGYQVDAFTCSWLSGHFGAESHICPGVMCKVSTLTYFLLEPGCDVICIQEDNTTVNF